MLCYGAEDADGQVDLFVRRVAGGALITADERCRARIVAALLARWRAHPLYAPGIGRRRAGAPHRACARRRPHRVDSGGRGGRVVCRRAAAGLSQADTVGTDRVDRRQPPTAPTRAWCWSPTAPIRSCASRRGPLMAASSRSCAAPAASPARSGWCPAAGGAPRRPFSDPPEVFADSPVFTADGLRSFTRRTAVAPPTSGRIRPAAATPVRLTTGPGPDTGPTVAADGTIAFINSRWRNTLEIHGLGGRSTADPDDPLAVSVGAGVLARRQGGRLQPQRDRRIVAHLDDAGGGGVPRRIDVERCRRGLSAIQPGRTLRVVPHLADTAADWPGAARGRRG